MSCCKLTNCVTDEVIITESKSVIPALNGNKTVMLSGYDGCWTLELSSDCGCAVDVTILQIFNNCEDCVVPVNYKLINCANSQVIYTSNDLSEYVGKTIELEECVGCWNVTEINVNPPTNQSVTVTNVFTNCQSCNTEYWLLSECNGDGEIITTTDLALYENRVIKLTYCLDKCWTVTSTRLSNNAETVFIQEEDYANCITCIEDVPEVIVIPPVQKIKKIKPGYNTPGCLSSKFDKINCSYAELMHKEVLSKKYGITFCCEKDDIDKLEIKKELLDLASMLDPDYICVVKECGCVTTNTFCNTCNS
jgi:hypothetical protein